MKIVRKGVPLVTDSTETRLLDADSAASLAYDRPRPEVRRTAPLHERTSLLAPALTILLSSTLLFLVQPILAKQILPWFGGSAGVWTICLVFFQVVLLLGYTYAHWLARRGAGSRQFAIHALLLLASCLTLPIIPSPFWKQDHGFAPELQILGLLCTTVGLPYLLLASTAPLLQRWLSSAAGTPAQGRSIYRLFALSNFGSLAGLLSYPFAIEPLAAVHAQVWAWSFAYVVFVACCIGYIWKRWRLPEAGHLERAEIEAPPSLGHYAYWIGCAALGSILLLAGTNQMTQNVASIPLLWIVPLSLYLLSFIICFEGRSGRGWYERRFWLTPAMLATGAMAWALFANGGNLSIYVALPIFTVGIFLGCVMCNGELALSKPNPAYLTHFYLSIAGGGALGGLLIGLVAPQVFRSYWEVPLALLGLTVLGFYCCSEELRGRQSRRWAAEFMAAALSATLILLLLGALPFFETSEWVKITKGDAAWGCGALLIAAALLLQKYRLWRAVALTALLCTLTFGWQYYQSLSRGTLFWERNFYGTLRVTQGTAGQLRWLMHGVIAHGTQLMSQRETPTLYYGKTSGIGRTILAEERTHDTLRVGSVGLGAGTLAAYGRPADLFHIYELNPAVLEIARNEFTYLRDSKAQIEPVLGDARLSLEREIARGVFDKPEERFDVLSLDAFSGDAIPVHLLTREAFAIYTRVIKPDGVIAFHLSNSYLDLPPVAERIAREAGYETVLILDIPKQPSLSVISAWVLATRNSAFLRQPEIATHTTPIAPRREVPLWTDQFTSLLRILK